MRWLLLVLILLLAGLQYRLWFGAGSWADIVALQHQLAQQQQVNEALKARNEVLEKDVYSLKNNLEAVEERARSELGLIKKGETFYLFLDGDSSVKKGQAND